MSTSPSVLVLNAGSSSIRFAVHEATASLPRLMHGTIERMGRPGARLEIHTPGADAQLVRMDTSSHDAAVRALLSRLEAHPAFASVAAVGHRIVHGMAHSLPERVTPALLAALHRITPFDPEHLPRALALVRAVTRRHPRLPQVACFDTAFHHAMPPVATQLPLPRRLAASGVRRYGFHGLSYASLMETLATIDARAARGRVILAHLGSGASLAAVHRGASIDTTMGFTPTGGLMMGTRSGDLDPGLVYYLARAQHLSPARFRAMVNEQSGLLGVSGSSADMRDLLAREGADGRAAEAVAMFCYQVRKGIGAYAAALGGLDTLVFSGGIGEHAAVIRSRICAGLDFLGVTLDRGGNAAHRPLISSGRVAVRVLPTDEARIIARNVMQVLALAPRRRAPSRTPHASRRGGR